MGFNQTDFTKTPKLSVFAGSGAGTGHLSPRGASQSAVMNQYIVYTYSGTGKDPAWLTTH